MDGQKTAAFEICDELGGAPDYHFLPVGNAGNITAYGWGFREYHQKGLVAGRPRMMGFQAAGAAPLVEGHPIEHPETVATAIRIGNPARWQDAEAAIADSGGLVQAVTDDEILDAYQRLAREDGVFVEPASAAGVAGLRRLAAQGFFGGADAVIACTVTGHGLKDPQTALSLVAPGEPVAAEADAIAERIGLS
jgi:threonine synthase